jgi:hypothetical protein
MARQYDSAATTRGYPRRSLAGRRVDGSGRPRPGLKKDYPSASIVNRTRVVFNIRHNEYRLVVAIRYDKQRIYVRFFGTHSEYDKIDAATI